MLDLGICSLSILVLSVLSPSEWDWNLYLWLKTFQVNLGSASVTLLTPGHSNYSKFHGVKLRVAGHKPWQLPHDQIRPVPLLKYLPYLHYFSGESWTIQGVSPQGCEGIQFLVNLYWITRWQDCLCSSLWAKAESVATIILCCTCSNVAH